MVNGRLNGDLNIEAHPAQYLKIGKSPHHDQDHHDQDQHDQDHYDQDYHDQDH